MPGVFPYRKTIVTFDDYLPSVIQPWTAIQRRANQMARSSQAETTRVAYIPGIGWRIRAYQLGWSDAHSFTDAQQGVYTTDGTPAGLLVATHYEGFDTFSQSGLTGVTYGSPVQSTGSKFYQKRIPAGSSFVPALTADQTAFPPPFPSDDPISVFRVAKTSANHQPWDALAFTSVFPGSPSSAGSTQTYYFCGPAGSGQEAQGDTTKLGTGRYALKVRGEGYARLYEKLAGGSGDSSWKLRFQFPWDKGSTTGGTRLCVMTVVSDCYQDNSSKWVGSKISFLPSTAAGNNAVQTALDLAIQILERKFDEPIVYTVPRLTNQPTTLDKIRLDSDGESRTMWQIARHVYPLDSGDNPVVGVLFDDVLSLDAPLAGTSHDQDLYLYWRAIVPPGCTVTPTLYGDDTSGAMTALVPATAATNYAGGGYQSFTPNNRQRYVRARWELGTTDPTKTPTLIEYGIYRSPRYQTSSPLTPYETPSAVSPPALQATTLSALSIQPPGGDPSEESASLTVHDFVGDLSPLESRNMVPIRISTEYDLAGHRSVLFQGYVTTAEANPHRSSATRPWPSDDWREYQLSCVGEWARFSEALVQRRLTWVDPTSSQPMKITDIIRSMWGTVYPTSMIDMPDVDIRLFTTEGGAYVSEPGTRIADASKSLADDYLGAYSIFDPNAGTKGMMRLLLQKAPPYNNLAVFERDKPAGKVLPHFSPAYGTTVVGSQTIVHTFIQADTFRSSVEKAEGNIVVTYGAGVSSDAALAGANDAGLLTQVAIKTDSYNFLGLASDHPNYPNGSAPEYYGRIVPIKVFDYKLTTQKAVDWKTRRIFDRACYARKMVRFTAPLILVTDASDALQTRPRPLRYYDAVLLREQDGSTTQYLVLRCVPSYSKDHMQMADYVLVTQSNINTIGTMPHPQSQYRMLEKVLGRHTGGGLHSAPQHAAQKSAAHLTSETMSLPELRAPTLQDLDPDSATFGQFRFLLDYDALG